jgi:hypothetical protein
MNGKWPAGLTDRQSPEGFPSIARGIFGKARAVFARINDLFAGLLLEAPTCRFELSASSACSTP